MSRPPKSGVGYFPKDTDFYFDDKVRVLRAEFGAKGMYLLDYLLCEIYRTNGYFLTWDDSRCFLVSDGAGCGCSPQYISEFVAGCIRCSLFDKRVLDVFGILTSAGIQRRYIRMFNNRPFIAIIQEYWLLNVNDTNDVPTSVLEKLVFKNVFGTENPSKITENPSKITENPVKEKENKVNDTKASKKKYLGFVPDEIKDAFSEFVEMRKRIEAPMTDRAVKLVLGELEKLAPNDYAAQIEMLNQSICHCWKSVYPVKKRQEQPKASYDIESFERQLWDNPISNPKTGEKKQ